MTSELVIPEQSVSINAVSSEAGPSKPASYPAVTSGRKRLSSKRREFQELQRSIESSTELLASLASYISTFQDDLSAVSGKVSDLQSRSADIEAQLAGREAALPPIHSLIHGIILPPALVLTIRDSSPAQNPDLWLTAIAQLDVRLNASQSDSVAAMDEAKTIIEGLRTKALAQLPSFLLSLIKPLRSASSGLSTNLAVLQTSVLLKYRPFYSFLLRHSPKSAKQVERGYVMAARSYYETGMRRYARALGQIKSRTFEKSDPIGVVSSEAAQAVLEGTPDGVHQAYERLGYANLDLEGQFGAVVLAYMADDKDYRTPVEALFRSLGLVLVDNASAEYTFIVRFFQRAEKEVSPEDRVLSPTPGNDDAPIGLGGSFADADRIWHEVFDPALESCTLFFDSIMAPSAPPAVPLLSLIRLNDRFLSICETRGTHPLVSFLQSQKLSMWPVYRKEMDQHVDSLKKLADEAEGRGLAGFVGKSVKDGAVRQVANRYSALFSCITALTEASEETMLFSSLSRMRSELMRLVQTKADKIKAPTERYSFLSSIYEIIMHELVSGPGSTIHPRIQSELSFFRTREEEARRRSSV